MTVNPLMGAQIIGLFGEFFSLHVYPMIPSTIRIGFSSWLRSQGGTPTRRYL